MKPTQIKRIFHDNCPFKPFNRFWNDIDLKFVTQLPKRSAFCFCGTIGEPYEIRASGLRGKKPRFWLLFKGCCYEIVPIGLKTIVKPNMEYQEIANTAKSIVSKKGTRFAWDFARRISCIISLYPLKSKWRQALTDLSLSIRGHCRTQA